MRNLLVCSTNAMKYRKIVFNSSYGGWPSLDEKTISALGLASISCWSRSDRGKGCAIMCDQQTRQSRSFQISQHLCQHLTIFTRHCAKTDHAESIHYGGTLQLYRISVSRHCDQCVDSLCSYLGDSTTAPAANIWSHQRDRQRWVSRESGSISMSNAALCMRA